VILIGSPSRLLARIRHEACCIWGGTAFERSQDDDDSADASAGTTHWSPPDSRDSSVHLVSILGIGSGRMIVIVRPGRFLASARRRSTVRITRQGGSLGAIVAIDGRGATRSITINTLKTILIQGEAGIFGIGRVVTAAGGWNPVSRLTLKIGEAKIGRFTGVHPHFVRGPHDQRRAEIEGMREMQSELVIIRG